MDSAAATLLIWGVVIHLVVDWLLQNEWMARHKAERRQRTVWVPVANADTFPPQQVRKGEVRMQADGPWWDRHPAAYIHAGMHGVAQLLVFPWWGATVIGVTHLLIDTRIPLVWWSRLIRQTQPRGDRYLSADAVDPNASYEMNFDKSTVETRVPIADPATSVLAAVGQLDKDRKSLEARLLRRSQPAFDIGMEVRIWNDQVAHIAVIALMALAVAG